MTGRATEIKQSYETSPDLILQAQLEDRSHPPISGFESKIGGALRSRPRSQLKAKVGDCKRPLEESKAWLQ
jgi:hypothetical protein